MQTHNRRVVSLIPPCIAFKTLLVGKATGNHLINSTSLEKTQSPVSGFCYARNRVCNAAFLLSENENLWLIFVVNRLVLMAFE